MPPKHPIVPADSDGLKACKALLEENELVAVPTETVYGLAGNGLDTKAIRKIFEVKGRPLIDPLISHFFSYEHAFEHVEYTQEAETLAQHFWPGPLTMILPKKNSIPDLATAGLASAGVRVPSHPVFRELLQSIDFPLVAPSANPFGYVSPTRPEHVLRTLGQKIEAILDGGPCKHGLESTIIDLRTKGGARILRPGPITQHQIEKILNIDIQDSDEATSDDQSRKPFVAPGLMKRHYSPNACVALFTSRDRESNLPKSGPETAIVLQRRPQKSSELDNTYWLSEDGSTQVAANQLFNLLQSLEQKGYSKLLIEEAEETGIGKAINNRLRRAAEK